jgi:hypothetical protein
MNFRNARILHLVFIFDLISQTLFCKRIRSFALEFSLVKFCMSEINVQKVTLIAPN